MSSWEKAMEFLSSRKVKGIVSKTETLHKVFSEWAEYNSQYSVLVQRSIQIGALAILLYLLGFKLKLHEEKKLICFS